jgi:ribonuclease R
MISDMERRAMAAERETTDRLIAAFLADRVGAEFDARVSGVTRVGLFVRLRDTGADGFVPAATIGNDYWRHHEDAHASSATAPGYSYRLGDEVRVRLVEAIPTAGALRFEMLSEGKRHSRLGEQDAARTPAVSQPQTAALALSHLNCGNLQCRDAALEGANGGR